VRGDVLGDAGGDGGGGEAAGGVADGPSTGADDEATAEADGAVSEGGAGNAVSFDAAMLVDAETAGLLPPPRIRNMPAIPIPRPAATPRKARLTRRGRMGIGMLIVVVVIPMVPATDFSPTSVIGARGLCPGELEFGPEPSAFDFMIAAIFSRSSAALRPRAMDSLRFCARSLACSWRNSATAVALVLAPTSTIACSSACCISAAVANRSSGR
jgi:hypothetical protein